MRKFNTLLSLAVLVCPVAASAQQALCADVPYVYPVGEGALAPAAPELVPVMSRLGAPSGVLSQAYSEALSVDSALLRMRIEQCRNVARVLPAPSVVNPNDPAAYKPKPGGEPDYMAWRFNMGKNTTVAEYEAWLKAKGIHVSKGVVKTGYETQQPAGSDPSQAVPVSPQARPESAPSNDQGGQVPPKP